MFGFFDIDGLPMKPAIEERMISIDAEAMIPCPAAPASPEACANWTLSEARSAADGSTS